jgi:hypothetical protein
MRDKSLTKIAARHNLHCRFNMIKTSFAGVCVAVLGMATGSMGMPPSLCTWHWLA